SAKARLKPTRCPSRSVSTSTPSQSKISALIIPPEAPSGCFFERGEEWLGLVLAAELGDEAGEQLLARLVLRVDHPQRLEVVGVFAVIPDEALDEDVLEVGRDVHLGAAAGDRLG